MPSIQNITNIPAPRVEFIDSRTGLMSREWYRFFLNLFTLTGGGNSPTSLEDLQLGPAFEFTPDMFVVDNLSPDTESAIATLSMSVNDFGQSLQTLPVDFGGTVSSVNVTLATTGTDVSFSAANSTTAPVIALSIPTASAANRGALSAADWTIFNNKGTVTNVAALTIGTSGTDVSSTVATGTTTPVITLNIPTASAANRGALSAADWTIFNNKGSGTLTAVTGTAPVVSSGGTTPAISMAAATTSVDGYLTAANFTIFNNKQAALVSGTNIKTVGGFSLLGAGDAGTIGAIYGGTGLTTPGTVGNVLTSTGSVWVSSAPTAGGTVTSVTGTAPVASSGGNTPIISMAAATTSVDGYLTAANFTIFNNKGSGTLTAVTGTAPVVSSGGTTPVISMAAASTSVDGYLTAANFTIFNNKGSGSVTSVAQTFTGGLISVSGSPITSSGTLALTVAGTSGGIPYFSSASTWATSAVLAANALVVGGGAGLTPATVTTGTNVLTALGVAVGTAGSFVVNGGALGTPSSGTVTNLTGTASININGTVGATTANTGSFTSLAYTTTLTGGTGIVNLGSSQFYKDASGNVGIGVTPSYRLHVAGGYSVIGSYNVATLAASSGSGGAAFSWNRSGGSAETNITNIFDNAPISFEYLQKTGVSTANTLYQIASTSHKFFISNVERLRVDSSGNVLNVSSGGLGYGTGSGGAVTQITSRTTGVTLDKTNGAITMFSATGSAVAATFTVTNSTVAATDTIILSVKSSTNVYLMFVTAVAAGSFNITFQTTGGVSTDAPVINFAVIKAVTA